MNIKLYSYLFGLFGTDGSIKRNESNTHITALVLELIDNDILQTISQVLPNCTLSERTRDTNFKKNHHSYILHCHNKEFIEWCEQCGFPLLNKTDNITTPNGDYDVISFWRGVIDGDGSIGMKTAGQPFISLVTKSEKLKEKFCDFIFSVTNFRPTCNRNQRDGVFNITLHGEKAQKVCAEIYKDKGICLNRKYQKFLENRSWKKKDMRGVKRLPWTEEEINDLLSLDDTSFCMKHPNRTLIAVRNKRQRMK